MIRGGGSCAAGAAEPSCGAADDAGDGAGCGAGEAAGVAAGVGDALGAGAALLPLPPLHANPAAAITKSAAATPMRIPVPPLCRRMRDLLRRSADMPV